MATKYKHMLRSHRSYQTDVIHRRMFETKAALKSYRKDSKEKVSIFAKLFHRKTPAGPVRKEAES